jgi:hypothetical protein
MINFNFNNELQVLEVFYEGKITLDDLTGYGNSISSNDSLPRNLKILADATKASYELTPGEIPRIVELTKEHIKPYKHVKAAFLQSKPLETALSHLLELEFTPGKYEHAVFSTRKAALAWLLS